MIKRLGNFKCMCLRLSACAVALLAPSMQASGFSYQSEHNQLLGHTIIDVGDVAEATDLKELEAPGAWGQSSQTSKLYRLGGSCFYFGFFLGQSPALIVVDKFSQTKLAIFDIGRLDISVKLYPIQLLDCRALTMERAQRTADRVKNMIDDMERQRQRNAQLLKELQEAARQRKGQQ